MFNFERLAVWQKAIEYADSVYKMTKDFPADERFGLTSQLRRSAVSVPANVAEGSSRFLQSGHGTVHRDRLWVAPPKGPDRINPEP
jgi:hypothetical protein